MKPLALGLACLVVVACSGSGSSSNSVTAPALLPASFIAPAGSAFSVPGCAALAQLNQLYGITVTGCPRFSAPLQNVGAGCAADLHGTVTIVTLAGQQVGSAAWSYANLVQPGEQIVISGGTVNVPSSLQFNASHTENWTSVPCR